MSTDMNKDGGRERGKVLLVDDHPILRQGLRLLINQEPDLMVIGEAGSAGEALRQVQNNQPDVAVVDIWLKDSSGIELIKDIHCRYPAVLVLVLSMHDESYYAERVLRAGARGYVTKSQAPATLITAIRHVMRGEIYLSESMSALMLSKYIEGADGPARAVDRLSDRELEVFEYIGHGMGTRQIAGKLHLSVKTVESHRANIKKKLKIDSATELLQHAIQWVPYEKSE